MDGDTGSDGEHSRTQPHDTQPNPETEDTTSKHGGEETGSKSPNSENNDPNDRTTTSTGRVTYTPRFTGFILLFGVLAAIGVLTFTPAAIAAATILLLFLLAGLIQAPTPPTGNFIVTYDIDPEHPRPAESVTITITVENTSRYTFSDLRLVDTVPEELTVINGSPRTAASLRPGDSTTITYSITAQRGTYSFGPLNARTRSLIGSMWVQDSLQTDSKAEVHCAVNADDIPLEEQATHYIGGLLGDSGGEGLEFYATREYHRGDSPSKINWRELAKRGELSTITYREQQAAEITIITDARDLTHVSEYNGTPSAASLSTYAGYQLTTTLINRGHYVGMAVPGLEPVQTREDGRGRNGFPYRRFDHGCSAEQQYQAFDFIDEIEDAIENSSGNVQKATPLRDFGTGSFREGRSSTGVFDVNPYKIQINEFVDSLVAWASSNTQFIFITPLLDDGAHGLCMKLINMGLPVIVVSPDPMQAITDRSTQTPDHSDILNGTTNKRSHQAFPERLLSLQRATRLESLRHNGVTVIDWNPNTPLSVCCERQILPGV